jgi:transcriptional regulator GlxA family with amidase domain
MKIAVLTFDAFNEIDSFVSATLLNRLSGRGWRAYITGATDQVTSRNGIVVEVQKPLEFASEADAVIFGSGMKTDEIAGDPAMLGSVDNQQSQMNAAASATNDEKRSESLS